MYIVLLFLPLGQRYIFIGLYIKAVLPYVMVRNDDIFIGNGYILMYCIYYLNIYYMVRP
jgi:hypothetical protein